VISRKSKLDLRIFTTAMWKNIPFHMAFTFEKMIEKMAKQQSVLPNLPKTSMRMRKV